MERLNVFNYSITNSSDNHLDVHIDGMILDAETQQVWRDWFGDDTSVSFKSIRDQVNASGSKSITFWVNSVGGHVGDAMAIHDWIKQLESQGYNISTKGLGMICSAATFILSAAKNSSISKNSWYMIHNVSGGVRGDVDVIENYAKIMRKFNDRIENFYVELTGKDNATVAAWMNAETWFTGDEANTNGFVKNVTGEEKFTNTIAPEAFPYKNTAALSLYNSFVKLPIKNFSTEDKKFLEDMMPHHEMAIDMAKEVLKTTEDPYIQALAGSIINAQTNEIEKMQEELNGNGEAENKKKKKPMKMSANFMDNFLNPNTDMNKFTEALKNAFASTLKDAGFIANKEGDQPKPLTAEGITNAFSTAMESIDFAALVNESVTTLFADGVPDGLQNALTPVLSNSLKNALKDVPTKADIDAVSTELENAKKDFVKNAKPAAPKKGEKENEDLDNKFEHDGITWGNPTED